jgi:peptidoglycan DL-endopeptidase CwlO
MTGVMKRYVRLAVAVIFVLPVIVGSLASSSSAAPSKADVESAKAKLQDLSHNLEVVIEQYNEARVQLNAIQQKLDTARQQKEQAEAEAKAAIARLQARAVEAYTGAGSQVDVLLGAQDFTEFSDRLEFMGALAQHDADLATDAANAQQKAQWAADQYSKALAEQKSELAQMSSHRDQILKLLDQQKALYERLNRDYQDYLQAQREAAAAAAASPTGSTTSSSGGGDTGGWTAPPDPPVGAGAGAAIAAAKSVIGAPYVFGSADPSVGFDCSGLTMWAWAHGGVSLPHSSASQAGSGVVIPYSQHQAGDLLFFYSPISHVALSLGGDLMIHARHPGPGGQVQVGSVSGYGTPVVLTVRVS